MGVSTKLKYALITSTFALVLNIVIFMSPGWAIVTINFPERIAGNLWEESFRGDKKSADKEDDVKPIALPYSRDAIVEGRRLSVSMGIWYFVACICAKEEENGRSDKECFHSTYSSVQETMNELPDDVPFIKGTFDKIHYLAKFGLLEFQIEAVLGIVLCILGVVTTAVFYKYNGNKRNAGLAACGTCLLAGVVFWIAIGKISMGLIHLREIINMYYGGNVYGIHVPVPWCLVVGGIASTLFLLCAVAHLFILSRDPEKKGKGLVYTTSNEQDGPVIPVATTGLYPEEKTDLPSFEYVTSNEEAGPLPEKEKL